MSSADVNGTAPSTPGDTDYCICCARWLFAPKLAHRVFYASADLYEAAHSPICGWCLTDAQQHSEAAHRLYQRLRLRHEPAEGRA